MVRHVSRMETERLPAKVHALFYQWEEEPRKTTEKEDRKRTHTRETHTREMHFEEAMIVLTLHDRRRDV